MTDQPESDAPADIQQMKLYQRIDRVERALEQRSKESGMHCAPVDFEDLDQLHYEGSEAVLRAIAKLDLNPASQVLDAGSGLGGPARWIAAEAGCRVDALELQPELDGPARKLTACCGLENQIQHVCGDLLDPDCLKGPYDALVSWLVFLHIPDRARLLQGCRSRLKSGGGIYIEDFFVRQPLTAHDTKLLREEVYCSHLVSREDYIEELTTAGFAQIEFEDRTEIWRDFVSERERAFIAGKDGFIETYDAPTFEALASFYESVRTLFAGGRLGGCCVSARASA